MARKRSKRESYPSTQSEAEEANQDDSLGILFARLYSLAECLVLLDETSPFTALFDDECKQVVDSQACEIVP